MKKVSYIKDFKQWKNSFKFSIPIFIRFSETDMFGHMNNVSPFIYFEEGRIKYFKSIGLYVDLRNPKQFPIVADLQCDFHSQVYFDEEIDLYVKADSVGNSSFDIHYMALSNNKEICFTGRGRLVNIDAKTGKPTPLNEEIREKLKQN